MIKEAIYKFDIETYLIDRGVESATNVEWVLTCPQCGKDKLVVNLQKRAYHCWVCEGTAGGKGGLLDLIRLLDGCSRKEAADKVLVSCNPHTTVTAVSGELVRKVTTSLTKKNVFIDPPPFWRYASLESDGILPYLTKRGISLQDAKDFGLLWCGSGRYENRLIFPVWEDGVLVYWQARAMWEASDQPEHTRYVKALNPPKREGSAGSGDVLFNLDRAKTYPRVCITEGPIDAIHVGPDAVCTFGKKLSPAQIRLLLASGVRAIDLMWDGPSATETNGAWPEMFKVAQALIGVLDVRLVFLPAGDPGEYAREHLAWFRQNNVRRSGVRHLQEV